MYIEDKIDEHPLVAVVGFTASGKTALGIELAKQLNGEIIAADAMTVYKDFDIGSAKPTQKEWSKIQHHGVNVADAAAGFSAAEFQKLAQKSIGEIIERDHVPILVGGTGLYVDSILYDYDFRTATDYDFRRVLNNKSLEELIDLANEKGLPLDTVDRKNKRRVIRLIETDGQMPHKKPLRNNTLVLAIDVPKEQLLTRISERTEMMLEQGLETEVKRLYSIYGWEIEPMRSIGYREWREYFAGNKTIEQVKTDIITHTMQLAKKQKTWFKRNKQIHWVNNKNEAVALATTFMNTY